MEQQRRFRGLDKGPHPARNVARTALVLALIAVGIGIVAAGAATAQHTGTAMASEGALPESAGDTTTDGGLGIHATLRISIPFGFDSPLLVVANGREVLARGQGACTPDESVTVAVTVTQAAGGATATGSSVQTCTGQLQSWSAVVTADTFASFAAGEAEACGNATTRAAGYVTDTQGWCATIDLSVGDHLLYLPLVLNF